MQLGLSDLKLATDMVMPLGRPDIEREEMQKEEGGKSQALFPLLDVVRKSSLSRSRDVEALRRSHRRKSPNSTIQALKKSELAKSNHLVCAVKASVQSKTATKTGKPKGETSK